MKRVDTKQALLKAYQDPGGKIVYLKTDAWGMVLMRLSELLLTINLKIKKL